MYLNALRVRDLAGLGQVDLAFERGLNVVVGDNEAGKSTLLLALRAAFFQRHRASGESVRMLSPYGRAARPQVEVEFEIADQRFSLFKAFSQKPEARLEWAGGQLQGDAVEERLAELLGFAHGARGGPKREENQGAFGLLWVEQGRAPVGLDLGVGRDAVAEALEGEVGQILGGERGRHLLAAAKTLQDRFFTGTLRPKADSPLKLAEDQLSAARQTLAERQSVRREFEERMARLQDRRERLRTLERKEARARAEQELENARAAAERLDALQRDVAEASREAAQAGERRAVASERLEARMRLGNDLRAVEAALAEAEARLRDGREEARKAQSHMSARAEALTLAVRARDKSEAALEAAMRRGERDRLAADEARLERDLIEAGEAEGRRSRFQAVIADTGVDARRLKEIEDAARSAREAEIRMDAASPALRFEPDAGRSVRDDKSGETIDSSQELRIEDSRVFRLEGFGWVHVRAGEGAAGAGEAARAAKDRLLTLLKQARVPTLEAARQAEAARREAEVGARQAEESLKRLAPTGLRALRDARDKAAAASRALAQAGDGEAGDDSPLEELRKRQADARAAHADAATALEAARAALGEHQRLGARIEADAEHHRAQAAQLRAENARQDAERPAAALAGDLAEAERATRERQAILSARREALEQADPDAAKLELGRARDALTHLDRMMGELVREISTLEGELRVQGARGINEEIARLDDEIAELEERCARLSLEARASRLLHETLEQAQREAREHWLGPIQSRLQPYLRLVQPDARVEFDETSLEIRALQRAGQDEEFSRLSHGAREQLAVIARLALAEVLKSGGHPATVILDDALVNTDDKRLARMHLVLRRGAQSLQVIVLTCRENDFIPLGAPLQRL